MSAADAVKAHCIQIYIMPRIRMLYVSNDVHDRTGKLQPNLLTVVFVCVCVCGRGGGWKRMSAFNEAKLEVN